MGPKVRTGLRKQAIDAVLVRDLGINGSYICSRAWTAESDLGACLKLSLLVPLFQATDMKQHFSQVSLFNTKMSAALPSRPSISGSGGHRHQSQNGTFSSRSVAVGGVGGGAGAAASAAAYNRPSREASMSSASGRLQQMMHPGTRSASRAPSAQVAQLELMMRTVSEGKLSDMGSEEGSIGAVVEMQLDDEMRSLVLQVGVWYCERG